MKSVLIVEDDENIARVLGMRLKKQGYAIYTAHCAISAMEQYHDEVPDVVLMDINLPDGDGFMVAEQFHIACDTKTPPIVFITASRSRTYKQRAFEHGATAYLEKPFESQELSDAIEDAFHKTTYHWNI
jgi:DNA-binding response OmpR family regulator